MLTQVSEIDQATLKILMAFTIQRGSNLITFGPAGIGKTEIAMQVCEESGHGHKYLNLSVLEAPDLLGLPTVSEKTGKSVYALPEGFPLVTEEDSKETVLLVDELDKAKPELQNPMLELFQFRSINGTKLKFKAVIATGNLPDEGAYSQTVSHALTNRCGVYRVTHSFDAWQNWAVPAGVNPLIVGFLSRSTNFLLQPPPDGDETAYCHPSPRAWTLAARDLDATSSRDSIEFQELLVAGRVGTGAATKFKVWLEHYRHVAPAIDALVQKGTHPPKDMTLDRLFVCAISGVDAIMEATRNPPKGSKGTLDKVSQEHKKVVHQVTDNVFKWLKELPGEVCIGAVKSTLNMQIIAQYELTKNQPFMDVYMKIRKAMKDS